MLEDFAAQMVLALEGIAYAKCAGCCRWSEVLRFHVDDGGLSMARPTSTNPAGLSASYYVFGECLSLRQLADGQCDLDGMAR